jgi:hypothetical protein
MKEKVHLKKDLDLSLVYSLARNPFDEACKA